MDQPTRVRTKAKFEMYKKVVVLETFRLPSGQEDDFLLFDAVGRPSVVFPLTTEGKLVVLHHYRYAPNGWFYANPGEPSQPARARKWCAKELLEETGYHAETIAAINLGP